METPQTYCAVISSDHSDITSKDAKIATIAGQILSARLLANIREEMGAVYSISASGSIDDNPTGLNVSLLTAFPMNPEKTDEVLKAIKAEFAAMAQEVTPEELGKVKEFMLKSYAERINRNSALANYAARWTVTGVDYLNNAQAEVSAITPADIQQFMQKLNAADNYRVVLLNPEN
jgi:zinc protease